MLDASEEMKLLIDCIDRYIDQAPATGGPGKQPEKRAPDIFDIEIGVALGYGIGNLPFGDDDGDCDS